jgi:ligand-binding sensor domain-containing protein/serine phosphatase RsbU (regulator of sigma subunit)
MRFHKTFIIAFLHLVSLFLNAQTYHFTNFGVQDGLAQSNVAAIIQDKQGYFWMATESGVSRFDGKNFITYTTENGLANNNVSALLLDNKGNIWMGHENGMLTKYDPAGEKTFKAIRSEALPKDKKIYSLYQDKKGNIWICTAQFGAIVLDPENLAFKAYAGKEGLSQYVFSAFQDKAGNMYFLTDVGIKYLDTSTNKFEFFRPEEMPFGQITSFTQDDDGNFLVGTSNSYVSKYFTDKKQFVPIIDATNSIWSNSGLITSNFVYSLYSDEQKNIWASVLNLGIYKYESATKRLILFNTNNGLAVNKVKCIAEDNEGNILLGTSGEGVQVFKGEKFVSFTKKDGLINNQVWSICRDKKNNFWFGTNEGISVYSPNEIPEKQFKNFVSIDGVPSNNVRSIVTDRNGNLWIGTWGGKVAKFDLEKNKFIVTPQLNEVCNAYVSCLLVDKNNKLWAGSVDGIAQYDLKTGATNHVRTIDGLSDNDITCLYEDSKGKIWIGTKQKGITVCENNAYKKIGAEQGLTFNSISSIAEDKTGKIWIGTEGGGAYVYDNDAFSKYKVIDGLISDFITLINVDDNGNVWLGTNKGLSKYDVTKKTFLSYAKNDGFTGIETKADASYRDTEGNLWFGTVNGVFKYTPKFDNTISQEPLLQFISVKVNGKAFEVTSEVPELSYKENSLRFDFIGISLSNPDEVKYLVKLEGADENWRAPGKQNFETFSNLHAGHYKFQVMACNSSGACTKEPLTFNFVITPPFWKTWWFYVSVTIIGLIIMFSYIKIRERQLITEKKILEEKVRERTAEVVEKNIELDEKNKDITASIRYAKRIQDAILPPDEYVKKYLPKTFILFKPKDIVSGDFYWLQDKKDQILFAAVDCTGHGVPGAFMSIVGHNAIDQIVKDQGLTKPSDILDALNKSVSDTLRQSNSEDNAVKDGMDLALCSFDRRTNVMEYAGAFNPFWMVRNGEFMEIKADKFPIGNLKKGENKKFTNHSIPLQKGDTIYVFSDGFADQFGGPSGKKFKYSSFRTLLLENQHLSMEEQGQLLNKTIEGWKGDLEQVDDILVIGTRL